MMIDNFPPEILIARSIFLSLYSTFKPTSYYHKGKRHKSQKSRSNRRKSASKAKNR